MPDLLIRRDETEKVLRSVRDVPGIVGVSHPGGERFAFTIDPKYMPSGHGITFRPHGEDQPGIPDSATEVEVSEMVAACASREEMYDLWNMVRSMAGGLVSAALNGCEEQLESCVQFFEFLIEVRDVIVEHVESGDG